MVALGNQMYAGKHRKTHTKGETHLNKSRKARNLKLLDVEHVPFIQEAPNQATHSRSKRRPPAQKQEVQRSHKGEDVARQLQAKEVEA